MLAARPASLLGKDKPIFRDRDGSAVVASNETSKPDSWFMTRLEQHPLLIGSGIILSLAITVALVTVLVGNLTGGPIA
jgi:hypothetical protein